MLVYGDRVQCAAPGDLLEMMRAELAAAAAAPHWILRQQALVAALIEAGRLAQGVADAEFEARGCDAGSPAADGAMALARALAEQILDNLSHPSSRPQPERRQGVRGPWTPDRPSLPSGMTVDEVLAALAAQRLPEGLQLKSPEGYAYYALYPETYGLAALTAPFPTPPAVLGLRSIGTSLAAMVAAAAGATTLVTARPYGKPFSRKIKLSPERLTELLTAGSIAIVDEGPGLSGSSFGAAADVLEAAGATPERLWFLPSHAGGPGPQASEAHRRRWAGARRLHAPFEDFALAGLRPLADWFQDLVGPAVAPLEDLSGGAWRGRLGVAAPVHAMQERRKYLLQTGEGEFLLKFSSLGPASSGKLERAQALHRGGFTPEPLALRHGFLLERWRADTRPLAQGFDRAALLTHLARYLEFRRARFPADRTEGASPHELIRMAAYNASELLGEAAGERVRSRLAPLATAALHPVRIDGRMHAWEWRVAPDGRLLKTDALDHADSHDLIGCQDIAWDVAGAVVELELSPNEAADLCARTQAAPELVNTMQLAYLSFQAGAWSLAQQAAAAEEHAGIAALIAGYRTHLAALLA